jgi:phosphohistidine phosphatase
MYLYLIRHGIAVDRDSQSMESIGHDELRSLTKEGRKKVERVADRLLNLNISFDLIITSPLVRAQQTADILIERKLSTRLEISEDLKPQGNLSTWLQHWHNRPDRDALTTVALVGHEPNLSEWAELLIFGRVHNRLILKKSGIIGLKFTPADADAPLENRLAMGTAQIYCLVPPKLMMSAKS